MGDCRREAAGKSDGMNLGRKEIFRETSCFGVPEGSRVPDMVPDAVADQSRL